jgi:hypothetical protein
VGGGVVGAGAEGGGKTGGVSEGAAVSGAGGAGGCAGGGGGQGCAPAGAAQSKIKKSGLDRMPQLYISAGAANQVPRKARRRRPSGGDQGALVTVENRQAARQRVAGEELAS